MDKLRQWVALTVVASLAVLAAGWVLLVSPKRAEADELRASAEQASSSAATLRTQLSVLKAQAKDLPQQESRIAAVAARIPDDPGLPTLVRALTAASKTAGVELVSVTPGPPAPVLAATPAGPASPDGTAATAAAKPAGGLIAIPVTLSVVGGYYQVERYLAALEDLPRAFRVSGLTVAPGANPVAPPASGAATSTTDGRTLTTMITGTVFAAAAAGPPGAGAAAVPAAPGATAAAPALSPAPTSGAPAPGTAAPAQ